MVAFSEASGARVFPASASALAPLALLSAFFLPLADLQWEDENNPLLSCILCRLTYDQSNHLTGGRGQTTQSNYENHSCKNHAHPQIHSCKTTHLSEQSTQLPIPSEIIQPSVPPSVFGLGVGRGRLVRAPHPIWHSLELGHLEGDELPVEQGGREAPLFKVEGPRLPDGPLQELAHDAQLGGEVRLDVVLVRLLDVLLQHAGEMRQGEQGQFNLARSEAHL